MAGVPPLGAVMLGGGAAAVGLGAAMAGMGMGAGGMGMAGTGVGGAADPGAVSTVYVGNLPATVDEYTLMCAFAPFGPITHVQASGPALGCLLLGAAAAGGWGLLVGLGFGLRLRLRWRVGFGLLRGGMLGCNPHRPAACRCLLPQQLPPQEKGSQLSLPPPLPPLTFAPLLPLSPTPPAFRR